MVFLFHSFACFGRHAACLPACCLLATCWLTDLMVFQLAGSLTRCLGLIMYICICVCFFRGRVYPSVWRFGGPGCGRAGSRTAYLPCLPACLLACLLAFLCASLVVDPRGYPFCSTLRCCTPILPLHPSKSVSSKAMQAEALGARHAPKQRSELRNSSSHLPWPRASINGSKLINFVGSPVG